MNITVNQYSSLDKIFKENTRKPTELKDIKALKGERISYQLQIICDESKIADIEVQSELSEYIKVYREGFVICDMPTYEKRNADLSDEDYLVHEPALIPDILQEIENKKIRLGKEGYLLWIRVDVPENINAGDYEVVVNICDENGICKSHKTNINVLDLTLPKNEIIYTQWFHTDCIASYYNAEIYSERHWELIEEFMKTAVDCGINMILTPVHNPPLDTEPGKQRPNVQLVKISKNGMNYTFDFSRLERWVALSKKYGFKYYEIPHFFSQWGSASAPNIYVDDVLEFNCLVPCDSDEYKNFLNQYINVLIPKLKELDIYENAYFHISDEPNCNQMTEYKKCVDMVNEYSGGLRLMDALSDIEFYKNGLIKIPVSASSHIEPFLNEDIKERWVYYCCGQGKDVSNRFIAMSSYRTRIMGTQMYKFNIDGFLQWGYNFYYSERSIYEINPYVTTSSDYAFPSGDAFSVYPGKDKAEPSIRALVFYEGLQDAALLKMLEKKTNHEYVCNIIDELAGKDVRFADYPNDEQFIFNLRNRVIAELENK